MPGIHMRVLLWLVHPHLSFFLNIIVLPQGFLRLSLYTFFLCLILLYAPGIRSPSLRVHGQV